MIEATENAGSIATEIVEAAVEQAKEAEQAAIETAEQIASAAIETERGERVSRLEERIDQCQATLNSLPEMLAAQTLEAIQTAANSLRLELSTEMNNLLSAAVAGLANPTHQSLIPPVSEEPVPVPVAIMEPEAMEAPPAEPVQSAEDHAKKKRHRFL